MPKVSEIMTRDPASCAPEEPIINVGKTMKQQDVGSVPIVESRQNPKLIGIVTDRDIVLKIVAEGRDPSTAKAKDAMTSNPTSVRDTDDTEAAMKAMAERQVRRIPVVDASGQLIGIVAQADIATRVKRDAKTGELVEAISEPSGVHH
jgi:CBS domain-containing protein